MPGEKKKEKEKLDRQADTWINTEDKYAFRVFRHGT